MSSVTASVMLEPTLPQPSMCLGTRTDQRNLCAACANAASAAKAAAKAQAVAFAEAFAQAEECGCMVDVQSQAIAFEDILVEAVSSAASDACSSGALLACLTCHAC